MHFTPILGKYQGSGGTICDVKAFSPRSAATQRLPLLDGLRGVAAIAVMLYHVEGWFDIPGPFGRAYLFVDFFFLLSGFVLGVAAEPRITNWRTFMNARVKRLWPVIAIGVALGAGAMLGQVPLIPLMMNAAIAMAMVPAFWQAGVLYPLNAPQWSLLLELLANLVHAILLVRLSERTLWILTAIFGVLLAVAIAQHGANTAGVAREGWLYGLPRLGFAYVLGVALARRFRAGGLPRFQEKYWLPALMLPLIAICALDVFAAPDAGGDMLASLVLFPILFLFAAGTGLPKALEPLCSVLGRISYPLYATHIPVVWFAGRFAEGMTAAVFVIVFAPALAWVIARRLEPAPGKKAGKASKAQELAT